MGFQLFQILFISYNENNENKANLFITIVKLLKYKLIFTVLSLVLCPKQFFYLYYINVSIGFMFTKCFIEKEFKF